SWHKSEPEWMTRFRLNALNRFERKPMLEWFARNMPYIDFDDIYYYIKPTDKQVSDWDMLPQEMKATYEKLGIPEAERKYLAGVTAQYECLRGSTHVWTARGMRAIKELEPGDTVFSLDESTRDIVPSRVVAGACSGEKEVFEIRARGRVIGASANHPFLVLRDERKDGRQRARFSTRWVPVEDLRVGDYVAIATDAPDFGESSRLTVPDRADAAALPRATTEDIAWFLGVYLGDGYLKNGNGYATVEIAVDASDEVLVEEIVRVAQDEFGVTLHLAGDRQRVRGRGTAALAEFIEANGLAGTAHTKRVPDWVFSLPRSQRLAFLAGYVDADGYVREHASNKDVVISSANDALLDDVKQLAALCGIGSSSVIEVKNRHPFDADRVLTAYRLHLSGRFDRLPCRSPRRQARLGRRSFHHAYRSAKGTTFRAHTSEMLGFVRVESIESVGVEPVYDIEVAGHHNFVAEGFVVHNSEVVYHKNREDLEKLGVLFSDMDTALREWPDIVKENIGTVIPPGDNKFAALNSAGWSGGSFIYVPPGVHVEMPLQAYFRINAENAGQFERTLIIADEGASVHYIEGCSAPIYTSDSLHSAVVELIAKPGARIRYTTIQNWSNNVYNLVQARRRLRGRDDGVGRRQPRLEADDEVPGDLAARRARARRGAVDRVRRGRPAPGRGREVRPRGAEHVVGDHLQVDLEERRAGRLPGSARGREGREELEVEGRLRRADPRRGLALRHLSVHPDRRERGRHRPRGDGVEDRRGAALLPDVARAVGGRGVGDDRLRLRRADHEGAAARVRSRDEPAHSAADGRICWLTPPRRPRTRSCSC